jgi:hypothetical protein
LAAGLAAGRGCSLFVGLDAAGADFASGELLFSSDMTLSINRNGDFNDFVAQQS